MNDNFTPLYVCIETDESPTAQSVHHAFTDLDAFLHDWNDTMDTRYSTIEEFNEAEEYRTIYITETPTS